MAARSITRSCAHLNISSTARAFVQLAPRNTRSSLVLDFLVPSFSSSSSRFYTCSPLQSQSQSIRRERREFTSSARRQQTIAVVNPRNDEDGNLMSIEITPRATNRLKQIMTKDANPSLALRIQVESGGCHGFQYLMSLTTLEADKINEEDTVFEADSGELTEESTGEVKAKVVMDEPSLELLKGSKVDFTMELIGSQFKIVDNPLATSSCGCGTSFDIKA